MKFQQFVVFACCGLLAACGGGTPPIVDAGTGTDKPVNAVCLDADGDGVPGTGECLSEGKLDCNDADPNVFPENAESCNDRDDDCDGLTDEGLAVVSYYRDQDGDTYGSTKTGEGCGPAPSGSVLNSLDCNDLNPDHKPGATETCDGQDQDCDGTADDGLLFKDFYVDGDGDGFGIATGDPQSSCQPTLTGRVANKQDCDDLSAMIKPGASELCNKVDDNCDGQVDNGITFLNYYPDADGDGAGDKTAIAENSCSAVPGKVVNNTDCDDTAAGVRPGASETCNGVDDNCNNQTDEGLTFAIYFPDADGDGFGSSTGSPQSSCKPVTGKVANSQDCNDANAAIKPTAAESCNNVDDNCNGQTDDGLSFANYYVDADGDGYGASNGAAQNSCAPLMGRVTNNQDCNDGSAATKPGATETCNQADDNCNGQTDEGLTTQNYWVDGDNDGYGAQGTNATASCAALPGRATNSSDCNDSLASVRPGATEVCNLTDDNCNGQTDEGLTRSNYYPDQDADLYGSSVATAESSCRPVSGKVTNNTDCNDSNGAVRPGAAELCNLVDDNCDGMVDNGVVTQQYYPDGDGDGYGAASGTPTSSCSAVPGRVTNNTDCNDANGNIHPGAAEVCNNADDNCAGGIDEGLNSLSYYPDLDTDGFGSSASSAQSSCAPVSGKVTNNSDCNDSNAAVKPGATEVCNGVDDNCANGIDDGLTFASYYPDVDGDTYGAVNGTAQSSCTPVSGRVTNNQDCNDASASIKPGAPESCNNADDNCNGTTDEGNPGGGANCVTGQPGVCSAGTTTCQSGALTCLRNVGPSAETCDGFDNDCDNGTDEDFPTKGQSCTAGLGVCARSGTNVCRTDGSGIQCSATAGPPTSAACDGVDNDCDGIVDEPAFVTNTALHTVAWTDIEVVPYYYSATSCQGGVAGTGTDALVGGAAVMAGGSSGLMFQELNSVGGPVGAAKSLAGLTYSDVAIAQAGDGYIVAGLWVSGTDSVEIDFYFVDTAGNVRVQEWSEFRRTGTNTLDGLRLMRGSGKRVTAVWRESGVGIKTARVEPFLNGTTWSIQTPTMNAAPFTATTLVANTAVMPGVGADSAHIDWNASVNCTLATSLRLQAVAYVLPVGADNAVRYFTMAEDGTSKSAETTVEQRATANDILGEPELSYYRIGSTHQWLVAFTESGVTSANEDLRYFLSSTYDGGTRPYDYAYTALATENGNNSIVRPRASATGTHAWLSAIRYVTDASGFKRQVMTRKILLATNTKDPAGSAVEVSATTGACAVGDNDCRPGNKDGLTHYATWSKVYYSNAGAPAGTNQSSLSCR